MRKFLTTATALLCANAAMADVTGSVDLDVTENASGKYVATPTIKLGFGSAIGDVSVDLKEVGGNITLDRYSVGTQVGAVGVSFGDQEDIFDLGAGLEVVGGTTLANPAESNENLQLSYGGYAVMIGLTDVTTDVTAITNVQFGTVVDLGFANVASVIDYNKASEDFTYGISATVSGIDVAVTYADDLAYEVGYNVAGISTFLNGDENDALQNVGAGYTTVFNGADVYAEVGYNVDTKEATPAVGLSFSF
ncbi:hypothetical protein N8072_00795 [bacterium]|nr:hypothetical protein [bacterium]MDB4128486.1 hypothetical protein [bacterium]MDC1257197.1 hypothetical protein [bacterium]